jgi:hypothetical protein
VGPRGRCGGRGPRYATLVRSNLPRSDLANRDSFPFLPIDIADFALFSSTFNLSTGQPGFIAAFDFNGDGHIDIADFGQFSVRFFTVLP